MNKQTQNRESGSYTANLLGNIRSHIAGLQGYDVMALELIQNADDAKAESVAFDITDRGLFVSNSGKFTYCGDLLSKPCSFISSHNYSCDYHRLADVGSGGKLSRGENIGRFGIGFVSTYQVTDHPEIRSSGIKLTLHPEDGKWFIEPFEQPKGTTFFLPWADEPNTETRLALGLSHVSASHIDQLAEDFQKVLRKSLLFLRHVKKAEVRRNGQLLLACDLDRGEGHDLIVSFRPSGEVEQWHILRADATEAAAQLYGKHPRLQSLGRSTKVSIGLRIDPSPLAEGVLYAFLPTEQSTGMPMHINADFFPESDRKAIIFAGHQHEQAWNEMIIGFAAVEIARDLENLIKVIGDVQLWQILARAFELSNSSNHPNCFKRFWELLKVSGSKAHITLAQDSSLQLPSGIFIPRTQLTSQQAKTLLEIGGKLVAADLQPFRTAINQLGAPILTFESLVNLLEKALSMLVAGETIVEDEKLNSFYLPLWSMVNDLLPDAVNHTPTIKLAIQRLKDIPFIVTEDFYTVTINQSFLTPAALDASRVSLLLPRLAIAANDILEFPRIERLIRKLSLDSVVNHIILESANDLIEEVIGVTNLDLRDLYSMFADLDRQGNFEVQVYQELRNLPIWLSSRGLIQATHSLLPGNFTDPTGQADLLDTSVLTDSAREFVSRKLGVPTQTIEAFVQTVLPKFFNDHEPLNVQNYNSLITELANHPTLVNDEKIRQLLSSLPIVPTLDGCWSRPTNTYRRNDDFIKVLGDASHLWLDTSRVPKALSVHTFIDNLGIRRIPLAQHLVDRMLFIANKYRPNDEARRASADTFYFLCDRYEDWNEKPFFKVEIDRLREVACFPSEGDAESWHTSEDLYAPYRAEAFKSQAKILDFRNTARLKRQLLEKLDFHINPETKLVIDHLQYCMKTGTQPHNSTYQVLNERAHQPDPLISALTGSRCIYVESQKGFVRPNQLYWSKQQLGRYAFTITANHEIFKPLYTAIGVKDAPEGRDYIDILLDIVGEYFEQSKPVTGKDKLVYEACLIGVSTADEHQEIDLLDIQKLQVAPTILNFMGHPTYPDEVLLQDSEWHAGFFSGELDRALCKPAPELWPLIEKIGVKRLSESAKVMLEVVEGHKNEELELAEKLMERIDILGRLLHDKPTIVKQKMQKALSELSAISFDQVRIQTSVHIGGDWVSAPPSAAQAFYDIDKGQLILARPVGDRSWSHILNAIFHQLMPEESGSEISKLTLSVKSLMSMPVDEAHRELTDAKVPFLDTKRESEWADDLTSTNLDDMSNTTEPDYQPERNPDTTQAEAPNFGERTSERSTSSRPIAEPKAMPKDVLPPDQGQQLGTSFTGAKEKAVLDVDQARESVYNTGSSVGEKRASKNPRPQHKEQWDRRLLSYVRKNPEESADAEERKDPSEHNLAVEVVARDAVCLYEKARGRIAEQMAQTHPGYDIISRNPITEEDRFIEVKGVNGEWNQTGVGLSRLQFSNAQDYGDRYWLYVVEFVSDPQHIRVHPIRSPATQVTSFMFDGNWRDAVADERAEPELAFIAGARVKHQHFGFGRIESMEQRGSTRVMFIDFVDNGRRTVTLNLKTMRVVEEEDDYDHS